MIATLPLSFVSHSLAPVVSGADLLGILVKVTLLFAAAALLAALLRRQPAATRHFVWLLALAGALALALLTPFTPRLEFAMPRLGEPQRMVALAPVAAIGAPLAQPRTWARLGEVPIQAAAEAVGLLNANARAAGAPSHAPGRGVIPMLLALWFAGCITVLLWSALGHMALAFIAHEAEPVDARAWHALLTDSPALSAAARNVRVAASARVGAPLMWGWPRPVILLPREALAWPAARLHDALLHELAHVTRGDYLAQSLATIACAVFWFHPLAWHAAARLRSECEHACDDRVLSAGTPAPDYASTLLEVARAARTLRVAGSVAVGLARRSHLEGRLLAVLDEARPRATLSRPARATASALTLLVLVPLAGLSPRPTSAGAATLTSPARITIETAGASKRTSVTTTTTTSDDGTTHAYHTTDSAPKAQFERQVAARPGGTLELDLKTGGTVEIQAWDEPKVSVVAKLAGRDWSATRVETEPTGGGVRVRSWQTTRQGFSYSTSHRFEIRVPARYNVRLQSAGGAIAIVGVEGTFNGLTGGGDIVLDHVHGRAHLTTGGGAIAVTDCDLAGDVSTGGGAVNIERSRGGLVGSSGSGSVRTADGEDHAESGDAGDDNASEIINDNIQLSEPDGFQYAPKTGGSGFVRVAKAGGDVDVEEAPHGAFVMTGGGDVHVGPAAGTVAVNTGAGEIEVGPVAGSVWAGTGSGPVTVRLADPHGRKQTVDIASGTGKVILELPASLDARFDLESAYTDNSGHETRIDSAWKLEQTRTQAWDDAHGTPRRYVRARGVAGSGRGLIRVRTVNGDIEVRQAR